MLRSTVALHNLINNKMKNKKVKAGGSRTVVFAVEATPQSWACLVPQYK
jgi:hypothetical protein